jgi:hypothetical protein
MPSRSNQNLKTIRFADELLPNWAQLLDLASRLCPVPEDTRHWFSVLTTSAGVDDSRTVLEQCGLLQGSLQACKDAVMSELRSEPDDGQATQIYAGWRYALETMIQQATSRQTCSWHVEGLDSMGPDDSDDGEINLRRV